MLGTLPIFPTRLRGSRPCANIRMQWFQTEIKDTMMHRKLSCNSVNYSHILYRHSCLLISQGFLIKRFHSTWKPSMCKHLYRGEFYFSISLILRAQGVATQREFSNDIPSLVHLPLRGEIQTKTKFSPLSSLWHWHVPLARTGSHCPPLRSRPPLHRPVEEILLRVLLLPRGQECRCRQVRPVVCWHQTIDFLQGKYHYRTGTSKAANRKLPSQPTSSWTTWPTFTARRTTVRRRRRISLEFHISLRRFHPGVWEIDSVQRETVQQCRRHSASEQREEQIQQRPALWVHTQPSVLQCRLGIFSCESNSRNRIILLGKNCQGRCCIFDSTLLYAEREK